MNKEKMIPEIRFVGFMDDWEQRKLGDIADIKDSARISNELWVENGIPYLRSSDLVNGELNGELFISKETYEGYASKTGAPQKDDVLFTSGGKVGIVYHKKDESPVYVQGGAVLYVKTSTSNLLDGSFLSIYFSSPRMQTYMYTASSGGTIKHFTLKPANASPILFPSLSEQQQVGSFFKQLDDTIALHQQLLTDYKQFKKAMLQQLFPQKGETVPKVRFAGFNDEWKKRKLSNLYEKGGSGGTPRSTNKAYYTGNIPFLGISDISASNGYIYETQKCISEEGLNNSSAWLVPAEAISLAMYASVGKVAILKTNVATSQAFYNMVFENLSTRNFIFQYLLKMESSQGWRKLISTGTQANLNAKKVQSLKIMIPSIKEQEKIGKFFKQLDETIAGHEQKLATYQELKKALLQRMFV